MTARGHHDDGGGKLRRPPSYQEYASDMLAMESVRLMHLAERGLLATMRLYVWVNDTAPADPALLARVLGLDTSEVRAALTERVRSFFEPVPEAPDRLYNVELARQMAQYLERSQERVESGRRGGKSAQQKRNRSQAQLVAQPEAQLKLAEKSRDEKSRAEKDRTELSGASRDSWVDDYERHDGSGRRRTTASDAAEVEI